MQEGVGRVSYEECGECFFIPYSVDDVENGAKIRQNDIVSFRVCTNKRYYVIVTESIISTLRCHSKDFSRVCYENGITLLTVMVVCAQSKSVW